tara:strand:- start:3144 stop:3575 length:432 start_codon:yes stop_codon:yes gene_type:complete
MPNLKSKIQNSKPVPMPVVSDKNFKSNMPKIDGEKREKELMEKLREKLYKSKKQNPRRLTEKERELIKTPPSNPSKPLDDRMKEKLKEGIDFITGESASRRLASGGAVKKMESGGEVRASRKSARKSIDGCAVRGKTRAVKNV